MWRGSGVGASWREPVLPVRTVGSSSSHGMSRDEYVQTMAKRISYSRAYTAFYISVIAASAIEVVWIVLPSSAASHRPKLAGHLPTSSLFSLVESYVTLGLLAELGVRAAMQQRAFCAHRSNWVDMAVAAISLITSLLILAGLETPAEMLLAEAVIATRVAFRLMRLVSISRAFRQQRQAAGHKLDLSMDPGEALPPDAFADFAGDGYLEAEGARCDWEGAGGALSAPGGLSAADAAGYHNHAYTIEYAAGVVAGSPPATGAHGHGIGAV